jgi:hypothetical protein
MPPQDEKHEDTAFEERERAGHHVTEVNAASVALAAAVASQKPKLWSKNMIKLYGIMAIGYLVSTMNGFGSCGLSLTTSGLLTSRR